MLREEQLFSIQSIDFKLNKVEKYPILLEIYGENGYKFDEWDGFRVLAEGDKEIDTARREILPNCDTNTNWDLATAGNREEATQILLKYKSRYGYPKEDYDPMDDFFDI